MRVTRPLMLLFALAIVAGGCAQQPVLGIQMAAAPAPQGIDNVIYGAAGAPAYAAPAAPAYAMAAAPAYAAPAPSYAMAGAPAYGMAAAPNYPPMAAPGYGAAPMAAAYPGGMMPAQPVAYAPGGYAPGGYAPGAYAPAMPQWSYTLDSGDRLRVVVFGQDGLTNSYVVDASGDIAMPLIGSVVARGLTTDQLSQRLSDLLRQGFIREPHVAVEIEAYRPFFILGEVSQPGRSPAALGRAASASRSSSAAITATARSCVSARRSPRKSSPATPSRFRSGGSDVPPPLARERRNFHFTFFARKSIERCQASLAAASLKLPRSSQ
jgi:polysaccharide export outer membrane protein